MTDDYCCNDVNDRLCGVAKCICVVSSVHVSGEKNRFTQRRILVTEGLAGILSYIEHKIIEENFTT